MRVFVVQYIIIFILMLGAIIGDIVGSRFEFNNTTSKNFKLFDSTFSFTDDTICTVAIADALLKNISYKESLLYWCRKYPCPMGVMEYLFNNGYSLPTLNLIIVSEMVQQ